MVTVLCLELALWPCHKFWVSTIPVDPEAHLVERGQAEHPTEPHERLENPEDTCFYLDFQSCLKHGGDQCSEIQSWVIEKRKSSCS